MNPINYFSGRNTSYVFKNKPLSVLSEEELREEANHRAWKGHGFAHNPPERAVAAGKDREAVDAACLRVEQEIRKLVPLAAADPFVRRPEPQDALYPLWLSLGGQGARRRDKALERHFATLAAARAAQRQG